MGKLQRAESCVYFGHTGWLFTKTRSEAESNIAQAHERGSEIEILNFNMMTMIKIKQHTKPILFIKK